MRLYSHYQALPVFARVLMAAAITLYGLLFGEKEEPVWQGYTAERESTGLYR